MSDVEIIMQNSLIICHVLCDTCENSVEIFRENIITIYVKLFLSMMYWDETLLYSFSTLTIARKILVISRVITTPTAGGMTVHVCKLLCITSNFPLLTFSHLSQTSMQRANALSHTSISCFVVSVPILNRNEILIIYGGVYIFGQVKSVII